MSASQLSVQLEERFRFRAVLSDLQSQSLLRQRLSLDTPQGIGVRIGAETLLNFCSNDYLGLANDARVVAALKVGADQYGVGAGASALVCGRSRAHEELEQQVARFTGRERALLFCSGYMANLAIGTSGLVGGKDLIIEDRLNHASLLDVARISAARLRRYPHGDSAGAAKLIQSDCPRKLVLTDGIFSMDGDIAPVSELAHLCQQAGTLLAVDDAHGIGVLGKHGGGVLELAEADQTDVPLLVGTFGKALGTAGAFIAGPADIIEYLCQRARTYIYTTAPPPALAHATLCALRVIETEPERRQGLLELIKYFRAGARQIGLPLLASDTPIQPLIVGCPRLAVEISNGLRAAGILVSAIRPPTVPASSSRLRITISAGHSVANIEFLLEQLERMLILEMKK